jgi:hypothetical protein
MIVKLPRFHQIIPLTLTGWAFVALACLILAGLSFFQNGA